MMELAVFGTFLLFALALIVRFGLSAYYAQQVNQESFRHALRAAYETRAYGDPATDEVTIKERPSSTLCDPTDDPDCRFSPANLGQVTLVRDLYIPDSSNTFATGFHTTMAGGGSIVWGTDRSEYEPADIANGSDLPELIHRINGQDFIVLTSRFRVEELSSSSDLETVLCDYNEVYGTVFVDKPGGEGLTVDFNTCGTKGQAKITGDAPSTVRLEIVDGCLGDVIDPQGCQEQCDLIVEKGLPVPDYCGNLPAPDVRQGLDFGNFTRTHDVVNAMNRLEDDVAVEANTSINETTTFTRKIRTNPNVTPDLPVLEDDDGPFIDATTLVQRIRSHDWTTAWE
jgi:hypothetical protein